MANRRINRREGLDLRIAHHRRVHLDFINARTVECRRDRNLLQQRERDTRRLLPVAERAVVLRRRGGKRC